MSLLPQEQMTFVCLRAVMQFENRIFRPGKKVLEKIILIRKSKMCFMADGVVIFIHHLCFIEMTQCGSRQSICF